MIKRKLLSIVGTTVLFVSASLLAASAVFPVSLTAGNECGLAPSHVCKNTFTEKFKDVVKCNCLAQHGPAGVCNSPETIYNIEKVRYARFGSAWLQHMCEDNEGGQTTKECMDQWTCFMTGHPYDSADGACLSDTSC